MFVHFLFLKLILEQFSLMLVYLIMEGGAHLTPVEVRK